MPSVKLDKVQCLECHAGVASKKKEPFDVIQKRCVECHDETYAEIALRWKTTPEQLLKKTADKMNQVKAEIDRIELRGGHTFVYRKLYGDAEFNVSIVRKGNGIHNPAFAEELLKSANRQLDEALGQLNKNRGGVAKGKIF